MAHKPKWARPDRQTALLCLWAKHGNKCLRGHTACPNPQHYVHQRPKAVTVAQAVQMPCKDRQGNPIRDREGKPIFVTVYHPVKAVTYEANGCRLYDLLSEGAIADWVADDRAQAQALRREEQRQLHRIPECGPLRGRFSGIGRDIFFSRQPQYYFDGLGISGLTFKPFAKIRLASDYVYLFVEIGDALKGMSKHRRRKAIRHNKPLPENVQEAIEQACRQAVRHYLA